jgi:hypothetical protein
MPESTPSESAPSDSQKTVSAAPTKRFFISVLIKDIQFIDALVELVDNSVDSARTRNGGQDFTGVIIEISHSNGQFTIQDNAQGISINVAKNYAFRFGRPEDAPATPGTVGEFGVGMKRALFKIGRHFVVKSWTANEYFSVDVDVDAWESQPETDPNGWTFVMSESGTNADGPRTGTTIVVDKLYDYAIDELTSNNFDTRLIALLKEAHASSLTSGLQIIVNKNPVLAQPPTLLSSQEISPISSTQTIDIGGKDVKVQIIAGLGDPTLTDAGWYVYCNGRQIERAEKTERTGWNSAIDGSDKTPKPHWQFRRFRGYLFFASEFPDVLPWNTTKTGLNPEAPAYRRVRSDMTSAMLQVIDFLNQLDAEPEEGPLSASVGLAPKVQLVNLAPNPSFSFKPSSAPPKSSKSRISYQVDAGLADAVKDSLGARNYREVGELTFEYYVKAEDING